MFSTAYLTAFRDGDGAYLLGDKQYRLRVPAKPPVKRFWAVTAYNPISRSLLTSNGPITVSSLGDPDVNDDGSVDIYFGGSAPDGKEKNWIKPRSGHRILPRLTVLRPARGLHRQDLVLSDFELIK